MLLFKIMELWDNILYWGYNSLTLCKYVIYQPRIRKCIKKNDQLRGKYKGKRCFIVLNGPSLNSHDLGGLKKEYVLCTNYFYKSELAENIQPDFFFWLDGAGFTADEWKKTKQEIRTKFPHGKVIMNIKAKERNKPGEKGIYYTYNKHMPYRGHIKGDFGGLCSGFQTVAFYAVNAAIYMGFQTIYLLGLDFEPTGFAHFADIGEESAKMYEEIERDQVCGSYWAYAKSQIEAYALAEYAKKKNVKVVNLNPQSCIRAFEFKKYEDII